MTPAPFLVQFLLVAGAGFAPATFRLCIPLQFSLHDLFCGLDYVFFSERSLPFSLYTLPPRRSWLGVTWSRGTRASPNLTSIRAKSLLREPILEPDELLLLYPAAYAVYNTRNLMTSTKNKRDFITKILKSGKYLWTSKKPKQKRQNASDST